MASASTSNSNLLSHDINTNKDAQCSYCKATGHFYRNCPKLKKKKELEDKNGKKPQRPTYPECPTCGKKNHPAERCWKGAGASRLVLYLTLKKEQLLYFSSLHQMIQIGPLNFIDLCILILVSLCGLKKVILIVAFLS